MSWRGVDESGLREIIRFHGETGDERLRISDFETVATQHSELYLALKREIMGNR